MHAQLSQALSAIRTRWPGNPRVGIILGTGLGELASEIRTEAEISYRDIPYFPRSTAMAHRGLLLCGELAGTTVIAMAGRCHLYEGYSLADIQLPIRVFHELGVELLIVTNAAGGLNPYFRAGDVMVIEDHINCMAFATSPPGLTVTPEGAAGQGGGARGQGPGARSQEPGASGHETESHLSVSPSLCLSVSPLSPLYDPSLIDLALAIARRGNFPCQRGVYVGVKGPNYETRAEYRLFRRIGGDVVGMSTIPEMLAAQALGIRVLGISTVTNVALPDAPKVVTSDEVVHVAGIAEPKLRQIVRGVLESL